MNGKILSVCLISAMLILSILPATAMNDGYAISSCPSAKNPEIADMIQQVNESTLKKHVQTIQDFGPHPTGSEACNDVRDYIYGELKRMNLSVRYDDWSFGGREGKNIEGTLPGRGLHGGPQRGRRQGLRRQEHLHGLRRVQAGQVQERARRQRGLLP